MAPAERNSSAPTTVTANGVLKLRCSAPLALMMKVSLVCAVAAMLHHNAAAKAAVLRATGCISVRCRGFNADGRKPVGQLTYFIVCQWFGHDRHDLVFACTAAVSTQLRGQVNGRLTSQVRSVGLAGYTQ